MGYRAKPDIISEQDFDASQSNSPVKSYTGNKYIENLNNWGFMARITAGEQFDPNDQNEVKIPMEFRRYPVDELTDIHVKYKDEYYERFIETAEEIFNKYNEEMKSNPDNDLLYYETDECDSKLNIEHGHGGYLCNENGEWNTEKCVLKYCDVGYILDIENNKCKEDPCEKIEIKNIALKCNENVTYDIEPNKGYIFTIGNESDENCSLYFYSQLENYFFSYNEYSVLKPVENGTQFYKGSKIYTNMYLNDTEIVKVKMRNTSIEDEEDEEGTDSDKILNNSNVFFRGRKTSNKMSTAGIILISVLVPLAVLGIVIATIALTPKPIPINNSEAYKYWVNFCNLGNNYDNILKKKIK